MVSMASHESKTSKKLWTPSSEEMQIQLDGALSKTESSRADPALSWGMLYMISRGPF